MAHRLFAGLFLALALYLGWHEVVVPLAAMHHGVEAVPLRTLRIVMVPVGAGMRGTAPQASITQEAVVQAARAHLPGNKVRRDAVARFQADLRAPINAPAVAKGYAQFAEFVYLR